MTLAQILQALVRERLRCAAEQICAQLERSVTEYEHELTRFKQPEPREHPREPHRELQTPGTREELEQELIRLRHINSEQQRRLEALEPGDTSRGTGDTSRGTGDTSRGTGDTSRGTGDTSRGTGDTSRGTGDTSRGTADTRQRPGDSCGTGDTRQRPGDSCGTAVQIEEQEPPHIKEEPEEQLQELPVAPVRVKGEDDEDESSVLHQRPSEENREETNGWDFGAEPGCSSDPLTQLQSDSEDQTTDREDDFPQDPASATGRSAAPNAELVVKPHRCPECGKRFLRKDHLQGHMIIHTGERPHKCSFCEKTFIRQNHLKTHLRNHTGERPYSCPFCNRGFTTKALLTPHMRIHTGDRPFKCSECDKGFIQRSHLKAHVKTHSREKTFSCLICRQVFYERGDLMVHSRAAHPE